MTLQTARAWLQLHAPELEVVDLERSTATVVEAAAALGVEPARIAKTLALKVDDGVILLVTSGDSRLDNVRFRAAFGSKPRMLAADEAWEVTGHPVGGICPFGLATPVPVHLDRSLSAFDAVHPAAGSPTSSVRISPDRLSELVSAGWVDVCRRV